MKNKVVVFAYSEENPFRLLDPILFISQLPTKTEKQVANSKILKKVQKENK
jgi:hypothetical protein